MLAGFALLAAGVYGVWYAGVETKAGAGAAAKTASTGLLALALALVPANGWFWFIPLGLGLGALGDLCLALKGERAFLAGVGAFGLGHLAYAGGFLLRSGALRFDGISAAEAVALAVLMALLLSTETWLAPRTGSLRGAVRGYVGLIGLMSLAAVLLPDAPGRGPLRIGAALFVLSDLMLAVQIFVADEPGLRRRLSLALWPAYWAGQALIAWGAVIYWGAGPG